MNIQLFQQVTEILLKTHYHLELNDSPFCEPNQVIFELESGNRPFFSVSQHAEDCDLDRMDLDAPWGMHSKAALTSQDEINALIIANPIEINNEQPTCCPKCGSRTDFDELVSSNTDNPVKQRHHRCINQECGYEFIGEDDDGLCVVCSEKYDEGGDGYDGRCPSCADKAEIVSVTATRVLIGNQRYADSIIGGRGDCYNAIEIHGVRDLHAPGDPAGTCFEVDDENPTSYSVYVHLIEGGIDCVGDFGFLEPAQNYAKELHQQYDWPIFDYVSALNQTQKEILNQYIDGDLSHIQSMKEAEECGDGLLLFLLREANDAEDKVEFLNMLLNARNQLDDLLMEMQGVPGTQGLTRAEYRGADYGHD